MQRIIPFMTMEVLLRYAGMVASLSGAVVRFVLPNAIVIEYNGQIIYVVARDEEGASP